MKEFKLPSGAKLRFNLAPFAESRELYQSILIELKTIKADIGDEIDFNMMKDLFCTLLSSKKLRLLFLNVWRKLYMVI